MDYARLMAGVTLGAYIILALSGLTALRAGAGDYVGPASQFVGAMPVIFGAVAGVCALIQAFNIRR